MNPDRRKIITSPTINTPDPFVGFGGFCGWPRICRLLNGDLYLAFPPATGTPHGSIPAPPYLLNTPNI